jgi:hypothetical protein
MKKNVADLRFAGIAMFGGVAIICLVNYFVHARKIYRGPVVHVVSN